jgi:tetratricopeptide (TPR) repeat protein
MAQKSRKKQGSTEKAAKRKNPVVQKNIFAEQRGFWIAHWKEALVIILAVLAVYLRSMSYEFVLDDQIVITDNKFTKKGVDGVIDIFSNDSFTGYFGEQKDLVAGSRYRPLSLALFAVIHQFFGLNTQVYHLVNVLLYALLCLLIFRVLSLLFHERFEHVKWLAAIPFIGAVAYALHPVHTEAIANVKGCDEILAMLGAVAALYAVMRFVCQKSWVWLGVSGLCLFAGLFAKENAITFLAVIPMALYFFTQTRFKTWAIATAPAFLAAVSYVAIRYAIIGYLFSENTAEDLLNNPFLGMMPEQKAATILYTLGLYVKLLMFPYPLTHDYYPYHIPIMEWMDWRTILSALTYLALFGLAIIGTIRKQVYGFATLYFLATLSIVSNVFFPIGTFMNERFLFMPSLAFSIVFGYYAGTYMRSATSWKRITAIALTVLVIGGFAWRSWVRIPAWENTLSLNTAAIGVSSNSARANCFMGTALYQEALKVKHPGERLADMRRAEIYIDKSLAIVPDYLSANQMKSGVLAEYYRYDQDLDKLLVGFAEILERRPGVEYVAQYCEYLNKRDVDVQKLLDFYYHAGYEIIALRKQRYDYALKYLLYGYQLDPNNARINYGMGKAYIGWGDKQRSNFHLERAYQFDPSLKNQ